ncbi:hypothetical protein COCON_G00038990 [Conger conger]|uniref:Uncharacterized protein n=1 Tax=Conger conger TaxID=82655 RepID=A0A9Q1E0B0_CONCO|nr:hypothetical protein COCON_G00038990 [Conger conger]
MGLKRLWNDYNVLIVMGPSLGLIHAGWYYLKSNPLLRKQREEYIPEPAIVAHVARSLPKPNPQATPPPPPSPPPSNNK